MLLLPLDQKKRILRDLPTPQAIRGYALNNFRLLNSNAYISFDQGEFYLATGKVK
jgi:hypothetical protein